MHSILNKIDDLSAVLHASTLPDFIMITESWGNKDLNNAFFKIPGFELVIRKDRSDTKKGIGGGLLLYAKDSIVGNVSEFSIPEMDLFNQCCGVRVTLKGNKSLVLLLLYRPHHIYKDTVIQGDLTANNNRQLSQLIQKVPQPCIIIGDFNYSQIDWVDMSYDSLCEEFVDAVQSNSFTQHIEFPTHSSGTQPDIVLCNQTDILAVENEGPLGKSDHSMVTTTIAGYIPSNVTLEEVPDWRNADFEALRAELSIDWVTRLNNMNTEET